MGKLEEKDIFKLNENSDMDEILVESEFEEDDIDENEVEEDDSTIVNPFNTKDIKISNQVISLESLIKRLKYDEIDLSPEFQRKGNLWNRTKMSRLIESIILRLPLPIFYFDVSDDSKWIVIDGLQRLSTLKKFIVDKKLTLGNLEFLTELNGKKYDDLDRKTERIIEETQINTYQIEPQTPKEVRYSIFNRINTGGLTLNSQEIRQALNQRNYGVQYLREIAEDEVFKEIVQIRSDRMLDRELVLRYIAFTISTYEEFYQQEVRLSTYLDKTMEKIDGKEFTKEKFEDIKSSLIESLIFLSKIFDKELLFNKKIVDNKRTAKINRSLFEIWTTLINRLSSEEKAKIYANKKLLQEKYKILLQEEEFENSVTRGTNNRKSVYVRFKSLEMLLKEIIDAK